MAFDGAYLQKMKQEIDQLAGARIDKISQPTRESIVIVLRGQGSNRKLLLSAEAAGAKLHFTTTQLENPPAAPMFCMLLRKHLGAGRLLGCRQQGLDRVLSLVFETVNELGDRVELSLVCEMMGRRSNLILVNEQNKVIDAIKRVDFVTSEVRQLVPGITYRLPPASQRLNPLLYTGAELAAAVLGGNRDIPLTKAIIETVEGFSPQLCREADHRATGGIDPVVSQLDEVQRQRLVQGLSAIQAAIAPGGGSPTLVLDPEGAPVAFGIMPMEQFGPGFTLQTVESYSQLLDLFYGRKDLASSMSQKIGDLRRQLKTLCDRITGKLAAQRQELLQSQNREQKREYGDIIAANIYQMQKGDKVLHTVNFFDPAQPMVEIPLDIMLAPAQNAQRYYKEYRKAATAEEKLTQLIAQGELEVEYLQSVISQLDRAANDAELQGIREELISQGYLRPMGGKGQKPVKLPPLRYLSSDGYTILSGRNNLQNDQLTLREANNYDLWLHTQKIHGSHVIVLRQGQEEIPPRTVEEAAVIAACNSQAGVQRHQSGFKVPVDYTIIKNVKKPRGAKPGMVIYDSYQTAMVEPDHTLAQRLQQR